MIKWTVGLLLVGAACLVPRAQTLGQAGSTAAAPAFLAEDWNDQTPSSARYAGRFKVTFYWVVDEGEYPESSSSPIYLSDGSLLGRFAADFVRAFRIEAAAQLRDGRKISYLKKANRAKVVDRYLGTRGYKLTELKSIAVDPRIVPIGSVVYIPQAENVVIDGKRHNGLFYAHDIGSAVKGKHIDVFLGRRGNMAAFSSGGMGSSSSVDLYILE